MRGLPLPIQAHTSMDLCGHLGGVVSQSIRVECGQFPALSLFSGPLRLLRRTIELPPPQSGRTQRSDQGCHEDHKSRTLQDGLQYTGLMKVVIVLMLLAVLVALGSAGGLMLRKGREPGAQDSRMAKALAVRVGLSIALFLLILLAWHFGWIRPTGIPISA
mgnify:FL=1